MRNLLLFHLFSLIFCGWYLCSYLLQPFPANCIAAVIIGALVFVSFRNPSHGAVTAVFLTPLTISLGSHLNAYLGNAAPPFLPYAEMILMATLAGWIVRAILNFFQPQRFPIAQKIFTPLEALVLWMLGLWAVLAVYGIYPALYRNLSTSPAVPGDLFFVKILFAPVWGWADEFFPITMAFRILLLFLFAFYTILLIRQQNIHRSIVKAFIFAIVITTIYAVIQFVTEIGYSKGGNPSRYVQSTFRDNESFATFSFLAATIMLPWTFFRERWNEKILGYTLVFFFVFAIVLSNSRAVMLLSVFFLFALLLGYLLWNPYSLRRRWKEVFAVLMIFPATAGIVFVLSPTTYNKMERLIQDVVAVNKAHTIDENWLQKPLDQEFREKTRGQISNLTLMARIKLWQSALCMIGDSKGLGMGTGSYYRLTSFPRYQAFYRMENAHMYWLQFMAEFGFFALFIIALFFGGALWLALCASDSPWHQWLGLALLAFAFCNIVGHSLLQQEILWLSGILIGVTFVGNVPEALARLKTKLNLKPLLWIVSVFLLIQISGWTFSVADAQDLGYSALQTDTYGYHFDEMGHRYLHVGSIMRENVYLPFEDTVIEFRIRAPENSLQSQIIRAVILDEYQRILAAGSIECDNSCGIKSLILVLEDAEPTQYTALITPGTVGYQGNLLKSEERQLIGFYYYGYRLQPLQNPE